MDTPKSRICIFDKLLWHDVTSFHPVKIDKVKLTTGEINTITAVWRIQMKAIAKSAPILFPEAMREDFESQSC